MKIVFLDEALNDRNKSTFQNSIELAKEECGTQTFPEFDEYYEKRFNCKIIYDRNKTVLGFLWNTEAEFSWFMLKASI